MGELNGPPKNPIFRVFFARKQSLSVFFLSSPPGFQHRPEQVPGGFSPLGKNRRWEHGFEMPLLGRNPLFWGTKRRYFGATKNNSTLGQKSL